MSTSTFATRLSLGVHVIHDQPGAHREAGPHPRPPRTAHPAAEVIASSDDRTAEDNPLRELSEQGQDVRLSAPTATTLDDEALRR
ncbi:hypothetical protein LV779_06990 [Streptomyces thinghirensis]|nr:hypothetical protein [Streptomyces thinghirensis]